MNGFETDKFILEAMTGGKNTLIVDDAGLPSVMVRIPAFTWKDVMEEGEDRLCSAFIVNGKELDCVYISKYLNIIEDGRAYSLPGKEPAHTVSLETAREACAKKGRGWHLLTNAEWMAIAFWCMKNKTEPRGNNFHGRNFDEHQEHGILSKEVSPGVPNEGRTLTGTGPATWNHDWTREGIADLHGNIWDLIAGLRLVDGEIQIIPDNDSAAGVDESADSPFWKAILPDGRLVAPGTGGTLKVDGKTPGSTEKRAFVSSREVVLSDEVLYPQYSGEEKDAHYGYSMMPFRDMEARGIDVPLIARQIGLFPYSKDISFSRFFVRSYGERIPIRGGSWFERAPAGIWELYMRDHRQFIYPDIGFRSAYIEF